MYSVFRNLAIIMLSAKFFGLVARKLRAPQVFCCEYGVPPEIQGDRVPEPVNAGQDVQVLTRRCRKFHGCDGQNPSNRSCHQCA